MKTIVSTALIPEVMSVLMCPLITSGRLLPVA